MVISVGLTRNARFLIDSALESLKGGRPYEALEALQEAMDDASANPDAAEEESTYWEATAAYLRGVALVQRTDHAGGLVAFVRCIDRFYEIADGEVSQVVASALIRAGIASRTAGDPIDALQFFDRAIKRLNGATEINLRRQRARALVNRASIIKETGTIDEQASAYDDVVRACRDDNDSEIGRVLSLALHEKGQALLAAGLKARAEQAFRDFVHLCGASPDEDTRQQIENARANWSFEPGVNSPARSWSGSRCGRLAVERGQCLMAQEQFAEAITILEEAVEHLRDCSDVEDIQCFAQALLSQGIAYQRMREPSRADASLSQLFSQLGSRTEESIRDIVNSALRLRENLAIEAGEYDSAIGLTELWITRLSKQTMRERRDRAIAMYDRATALRMARRKVEAVAAFDAVIECFERDPDPQVYRTWCLARFNQGPVLRDRGHWSKAEAVFRSVANECSGSADPVVRARAARSLLSLAEMATVRLRRKATEEVLQELVQRFGDDRDPNIQREVGSALHQFPGLIVVLPPALHLFRSKWTQQDLLNTAEASNNAADTERHLEAHVESLACVTRIHTEQHQRALSIISESIERRVPFGLVLRNFSREGFEFTLPGDEREFPQRAAIQYPARTEDEKRIAAAVGADIPLVTVSNPSALVAHGDIPRLELDHGLWKPAVEVLLRLASLVIFVFDEASAGVTAEMQLLLEHRRAASTIFIATNPEWNTLRELKSAQLMGGRSPANTEVPRFAAAFSLRELPEPGTASPEFRKAVELARRGSRHPRVPAVLNMAVQALAIRARTRWQRLLGRVRRRSTGRFDRIDSGGP